MIELTPPSSISNEPHDHAPWQEISVSWQQKNGSTTRHNFVIFEDFGVESQMSKKHSDQCYYFVADYKDHYVYHVRSPHSHGKQSYDLDDPDDLCIGCGTCNEWNSCNTTIKDKDPKTSELITGPPELCIHAKALVSFLKKKREFMAQNIEPPGGEYTAGWISTFEVRNKK